MAETNYDGISIPYPVILAARTEASYMDHAASRNRHLHSGYRLLEAVLVREVIRDPQTVLQLFFWLRIHAVRF